MALRCVCTVLLTFILCFISNPPMAFFCPQAVQLRFLDHVIAPVENSIHGPQEWEADGPLRSGSPERECWDFLTRPVVHLHALRKCRYRAAVLLYLKRPPHSQTLPCVLFQLSQETTLRTYSACRSFMDSLSGLFVKGKIWHLLLHCPLHCIMQGRLQGSCAFMNSMHTILMLFGHKQ